MSSNIGMKTSTDHSPLAQEIASPGSTELGIGDQLLPISHGCQQIGVIRMKACGTLTELSETLAGRGVNTKPSKQAQRLIKRLTLRSRVAQHRPPQAGCGHRRQQHCETEPSLLITEQPFQPDLLTGLIETQPPPGPDQIQAPPLPLDPPPP